MCAHETLNAKLIQPVRHYFYKHLGEFMLAVQPPFA